MSPQLSRRSSIIPSGGVQKCLIKRKQGCRATLEPFPQPDVMEFSDAALNWCGRINRRTYRLSGHDGSGAPIPHVDTVSLGLTTQNGDPPSRNRIGYSYLEGPALFAGYAPDQFGHVLINALGRLWALDTLPQDTTLIYVTNHRLNLLTHMRPVLDLLGVRHPIFVMSAPTVVGRLFTATDLFSERYGAFAAPEFVDWLGKRLKPSAPITRGRKLYVSRTGLGHNYGRIAREDVLEELLIANGYEVFRPETVDMATQVATYQSAQDLIFAEGSPLHLYALVKRAGQRVAVLQRRHEVPDVMRNQMQAFDLDPIHWIDAISDTYWPPVRADNRAVSVLNFSVVRDRLVAAGMLGPDATWRVPTQSEVRASLEAGLRAGETLLDADGRAAFLADLRAKRAAKA